MKRILYPAFLIFVLTLSGLISFGQTYTLFGSSTPANPDDTNPQDIEVGTKFYVTQAGQVTDLRFYRGSDNSGTFIGHLWLDNEDGTGTLLATKSFTYTLPGWIEVTLDAPVTITPGNIYVVSYYTPNGSYGSTEDVFNSGTSVGADPLWALDRTEDPTYPAIGGNGVYFFNPPDGVGGFPTSYFSDFGTNYYADVIFSLFFPLPVTLTDFKAATNNKSVELTWKTQTENNNKGFEILRSNNNRDWYTIGFVNGAGNSSMEENYSFTDRELAPGRYYYRLNQQDFDGNNKATAIITALLSGKGKISLFQNTPNPVRGVTTIRYDLPEVQQVRLSLVDLAGREIKVLVNSAEQPGSHIVTLDAAAAGLNRQVYIIRLQTDKETITRKMVVK